MSDLIPEELHALSSYRLLEVTRPLSPTEVRDALGDPGAINQIVIMQMVHSMGDSLARDGTVFAKGRDAAGAEVYKMQAAVLPIEGTANIARQITEIRGESVRRAAAWIRRKAEDLRKKLPGMPNPTADRWDELAEEMRTHAHQICEWPE